MTWVYSVVMWLVTPIIRGWGRLEVRGLDRLPASGPCLVIGNHDSHWDPLVIGVAASGHRPIRALAKSSLWRSSLLARILTGMGQYPITRGVADRAELAAVTAGLAAGECVGIFCEGTISRGQQLRAYSGAGWLAKSVPSTHAVGVAITGSVDIVRFPVRPRLRVEFFPLRDGDRRPDESSVGFSRRALAELRERAPAVPAGRSVPQPVRSQSDQPRPIVIGPAPVTARRNSEPGN